MEIRNKLQSDKKFNPFSDSYDPQYIAETIKELKNIDAFDFQTLISAMTFNEFNIHLYQRIKDFVKKSDLNYFRLIESLITVANRDYFVVLNKIDSNFETMDKFLVEKEINKEIIGSTFASNNLNTVSDALDQTVEILNQAVNYIRYFEKDLCDNSKQENIECVVAIYRYSNLYCILKGVYDRAIWKKGYLVSLTESKAIGLLYQKDNFNIYNIIGFTRIARNTFMAELSTINIDSKNIFLFKKRNKSKLAKTFLLDGFLQYELEEKEYDDSLLNYDSKFWSAMVSYAPYIQNIPIKKFHNLTLFDLFLLYSEICALYFNYLMNNYLVDDYKNPALLPKINYDKILEYLLRKTKYSEEQIESFINSLVSDGNILGSRINFWKTPFIKINNYLLCFLFPLIDNNPFYLIENWLDDTDGISLKERGKHFEKYIEREVKKQILKKGFFVNVTESKKIEISNIGFEEIDLIVILKNIIIVGEVKCIKYPFDERGYHNSYKTLEKASNQISRKVEFLEKNKQVLFEKIPGIDKKEIVKCVITNYPFFTGYKINNVAIVDFFLLESYIVTGGLIKEESKINNVELFYKNEEEFSNNFSQFINTPPAVEELKQYFVEKYSDVFNGILDIQIIAPNYHSTWTF